MSKLPNILERDGLEEEFNHILYYPATMVIAPMGYGKSTSAFAYLSKQTTPWVMISFDSVITKTEYLWNMLSLQLEKHIPPLGNQLYSRGYPLDYAHFEDIVEIFKEHCRDNELIIFFDDFHNIQSQEFLDVMQNIFMRKIEGLHFLLLSRKIPEFRIEELILKNGCYLIDSRALELNQKQICDFFSMYGAELTEEECNEIYKITEGWISAVSLLQRRYMQTGRILKENGIENMLESSYELLYSPAERSILTKLALLDNFTLPLAIHLLKNLEIENVLMRMCNYNLFIRYDAHDSTYRMHNILRSFLLKSSNLAIFSVNETETFIKAGEWYIDNGDTIQGLTYLLKARDYQSVLKEFEKTEFTDFYDRNPRIIIDIYNKIPFEERYLNPIACLSYIGFYVTNIDVTAGYDMAVAAEKYFNETINDKELLIRINGELELIRAYINFNDLNHMRNNLSKAHSVLKGKSLIANPKKIPTFGSPHILYLYYRSDMHIFDTVEQMAETYPYYYALSGGCGDGFVHQISAEAYLETGDIVNAERYARKAIYSAQGTGQLAVTICSNFTLARYCIAMGEPDKALNIIEQLRDAIYNTGPSMLINCYEITAAYISCLIGTTEALPGWITSGDLAESDILYQGMGFSYIVYGKYLVMNQNYLRLEVLCERMQKAYSQFKNEIGFLHMHILNSIAKFSLNDTASAAEYINKALTIGMSNNIILPFSEYGQVMLNILNECCNIDKHSSYYETLLEMTKRYAKQVKSEINNSSVKLTEREQSILKLICTGKTNKEISEELFIAEITVRKNLTSIYRKLNVTNRASAIHKMLEETDR